MELPIQRELPWNNEQTHIGTSSFPLLKFVGPVQYLTTKEQTDAWCSCIVGPMTVGFDTEWKPTYIKGEPQNKTALIQLCCYIHNEPVMIVRSRDGYVCLQVCLLIHIFYCGISYELERVLGDQEIIKVGMAANGDAQKIEMGYGVNVRGIVDLAKVINEKDISGCIISNIKYTKNEQSLLGLSERLLGYSLSKKKKIRCGNWEAYPLNYAQQQYAANDAYASLLCYEALMQLPDKRQIKGKSHGRQGSMTQMTPHPLALRSEVEASTVDIQRSRQRSIEVENRPGSIHDVCYVPEFGCLIQLNDEARMAYHLFMGAEHLHLSKHTITDVAAQLKSTVEHVCILLADAILAGWAYDWDRIMIPTKMMEHLAVCLLTCINQGHQVSMYDVQWGHPLAASTAIVPSLTFSIDRLASFIQRQQLIQKTTAVIDFRVILAHIGIDSEAIGTLTEEAVSRGTRRVVMAHIGRLVSDTVLKQPM